MDIGRITVVGSDEGTVRCMANSLFDLVIAELLVSLLS